MKVTLLLIFLCSGMPFALSARNIEHTLGGNPAIPQEEIQSFYSGKAWKSIRDAPYTAYVVVHGTVRKDSTFRPSKVKECFPDESRNKLARKLAERVQLTATTVGSRVNPRADVYVVFYEESGEQRTALVFGKRRETAYFSQNAGRDKYLSLFSY